MMTSEKYYNSRYALNSALNFNPPVTSPNATDTQNTNLLVLCGCDNIMSFIKGTINTASDGKQKFFGKFSKHHIN